MGWEKANPAYQILPRQNRIQLVIQMQPMPGDPLQGHAHRNEGINPSFAAKTKSALLIRNALPLSDCHQISLDDVLAKPKLEFPPRSRTLFRGPSDAFEKNSSEHSQQ